MVPKDKGIVKMTTSI